MFAWKLGGYLSYCPEGRDVYMAVRTGWYAHKLLENNSCLKMFMLVHNSVFTIWHETYQRQPSRVFVVFADEAADIKDANILCNLL